MGVCTTSSVFCGFMIKNPDLRFFATAVVNFWRKDLNETIHEAPVPEVPGEDVPELCETVEYWLAKSDRPFTAYPNFEDNDDNIEPAIVLCYKTGENRISKWGRENYGSQYEVIGAKWADEEFLREAKEAFNQLGEDPIMKEAKIVPEMEWIQGLSVE
ncbi:hypothetical protein L208DRAFT_1397657 [Tricholoma matsutake]|nr:hypothetical protein L208DRAFT_1397657 [Tricholoma matsutake 945]